MAAGMIAREAVAESNTLRTHEAQLREALADRLGVHTRFASLPGVRAFLVSPLAGDGTKGLVIDHGATTAERIHVYLHIAAHVALKHHLPLVTIVESSGAPDASDVRAHEDAEQLARAMWWGDASPLAGVWPGPRSRVLRRILALGIARASLRATLLLVRRGYYAVRARRALDSLGLTRMLRDALCVTAVVYAAPELVRREAPRARR